MKTRDAINHFGGVRALADALRITPEAIYQWGKQVPDSRQFQIEVLTRGKLLASGQRDARREVHA